MPSGYKVSGTDLDSIFEPRGSSTARANTGYKVGGTDIAQRFYASTGGDIPASNTGYKVGGTDLRQLFRRLGYTDPPSASISGSSSVASGGGGGGSWSWSVSAPAGIDHYRIYVTGHGGTWSYPSPTIYGDGGTINWTSPLGSPDFSSTPGSYVWNVEVVDSEGRSASDTHGFTVV